MSSSTTTKAKTTEITFQCRSLQEKKPIKCISKYLVLCGNCGRLADNDDDVNQKHNYLEYLRQLIVYGGWEKIFFVIGPWEYFGSIMSDARKSLSDLEKKFDSKFVVLDEKVVDINEKYRIIGTTLWTNLDLTTFGTVYTRWKTMYHVFDDNIFHFDPLMSTNKGGGGGKKETILPSTIDPLWWNEQHVKCKSFLETQIALAKKDNKQLIIATHHLPYQMLLPEFIIINDIKTQIRASSDISGKWYTEKFSPRQQNNRLLIPVWFCSALSDISDTNRFNINKKLNANHGVSSTLFYANHNATKTKITLK